MKLQNLKFFRIFRHNILKTAFFPTLLSNHNCLTSAKVGSNFVVAKETIGSPGVKKNEQKNNKINVVRIAVR